MKNTRPQALFWRDADDRIHLAPGAPTDRPGFLDIIDQTKLPGDLVRIRLSSPETVYEAIRTLAVRGAPALGCAAALGLAACAQRFDTDDPATYLARLRKTADYLNTSRPTAVNLSWALQRCLAKLVQGPVAVMNRILLDEALEILAEDIERCEAIGQYGLPLVKPGMGILTHCNAGALATGGGGTALAPLYAAHDAGIGFTVYADETRPLLQGARLTAWELSASGIDVVTICDAMAAQVMREGKVGLVIVGADRVAANGDAANKIGTYALAIAARYHRIPFYVAMPDSTIDRTLADGSGIPIEQRSPEEIFHCANARVYNPAFDVTPHELISGYITERGILESI